ncbi:T9SS type A sorting domain-containing protein, partial [Parasediminibacterium sp. JCM 36343]|uniref:T9SS type A sorting domain-containing protein n=1 Tax=Parasediminibacterium sp. JCM 36343 TaxID=3374279 RepID=UPI00397E7ACA
TFNSTIWKLITDTKDNLFAAGSFSNANNMFYVAKWDGSSWGEVGGISDSTFKNGGIYTLFIDSSDNLYAAGGFTNGIDYSHGNKYVAKYTSPTLPLTLTTFIAQAALNNRTQLTWQTTNETNTCLFEIERSSDGKNYAAIGDVTAKGNGAGSYYYTDNTPLQGTGAAYYRLKMVDKDGSFTYSQVVTISNTSAKAGITLVPNPAQATTSLLFAPATGIGNVKIYATDGRCVATQLINLATGNANLNISTLASGTYTVVLQTNSSKQTTKLVKQ